MFLVMHFKVQSEPLVISTLTPTMVRQCQFHYLGEACHLLFWHHQLQGLENPLNNLKICFPCHECSIMQHLLYASHVSFLNCSVQSNQQKSLTGINLSNEQTFNSWCLGCLHFIFGCLEVHIYIKKKQHMDLWTSGCRPKIAWPCFQRFRIYKNMCRSLGGEPNLEVAGYDQNLCHYQLRRSQKTDNVALNSFFFVVAIIIFTWKTHSFPTCRMGEIYL